MRPIGFEAPAKRVKRSLVVGLIAGIAVSTTAVLVVVAKSASTGHSALAVVAPAFALGFFAGFGLAFTRMEFAPSQPKDDGDAEAGVPARLIPPVPTLSAKAFSESNEKTAF